MVGNGLSLRVSRLRPTFMSFRRFDLETAIWDCAYPRRWSGNGHPRDLHIDEEPAGGQGVEHQGRTIENGVNAGGEPLGHRHRGKTAAQPNVDSAVGIAALALLPADPFDQSAEPCFL